MCTLLIIVINVYRDLHVVILFYTSSSSTLFDIGKMLQRFNAVIQSMLWVVVLPFTM